MEDVKRALDLKLGPEVDEALGKSTLRMLSSTGKTQKWPIRNSKLHFIYT
jgi:hypothetical protein